MQTKTACHGHSAWLRRGAAALLGAGLMATAGLASAYGLSIVPGSQSVGLGTEVSVTVKVSNALPDGVGSYDFRFNFDPTVLAFDRVNDGLGLGFAFGLGVTDLGASLLLSDFSLESQASLLSLQSAELTLFTLVFDTVALGTSALGLSDITLSDAAGNIVAATATGGSVNVVAGTAVPEPSSWALVGVALAAGLAVRRCSRPAQR